MLEPWRNAPRKPYSRPSGRHTCGNRRDRDIWVLVDAEYFATDYDSDNPF